MRRAPAARFRTLEPDERDALALMVSGIGFADLCGRLVERVGEETGPPMAGALLGQWLHDGIVAAVMPPAVAE